ncbi:MAG: superoxide dismutase [Sphingobacteriaceae bacterium]|jgi:Cu-Zn family superoxide dismutase|nr:superoxide dismutase [Sphingobacteriaceae bacterium]
MKYFSTLLIGAGLLAAAACNNSSTTSSTSDSDSMAQDHASMQSDTMAGMEASTDTASAQSAHVDISATKQDTTGGGSADFTAMNGKVQMKLTLLFPKMANKSVAVHLHEHGDCGDMGKGAHGHWNPTNEKHGKWGSGEYHSGDIGNVQLDGSGKGSLTFDSDRWTLGGDAKTNILGRAVIVHSGVDDYTTQPTGNAGSRIGCGVIMRK